VSKLFMTRRRMVVAGITGALVLGGAGAAFAYFTSTGTGTGSASVGSASTWTVSSPTDSTHGLLPGTGSEVLTFTITNNSSGAQAFNSLSAAIASDTSGNVKAQGNAVSGCLASWFTASAGTPSPGFGTSIASKGTATVPVTITMNDSATNQDPCQGINGPDVTLTINAGS
jgi:hypothetical protein